MHRVRRVSFVKSLVGVASVTALGSLVGLQSACSEGPVALACSSDADCPIGATCSANGACVDDGSEGEGEGGGIVGEGEGEGRVPAEGEGEGEGDIVVAEGEGEGTVAAEGEGEGGVVGEGEGEGAPPIGVLIQSFSTDTTTPDQNAPFTLTWVTRGTTSCTLTTPSGSVASTALSGNHTDALVVAGAFQLACADASRTEQRSVSIAPRLPVAVDAAWAENLATLRIDVTVPPLPYARPLQPVAVPFDLAAILQSATGDGSVDPDSVRVYVDNGTTQANTTEYFRDVGGGMLFFSMPLVPANAALHLSVYVTRAPTLRPSGWVDVTNSSHLNDLPVAVRPRIGEVTFAPGLATQGFNLSHLQSDTEALPDNAVLLQVGTSFVRSTVQNYALSPREFLGTAPRRLREAATLSVFEGVASDSALGVVVRTFYVVHAGANARVDLLRRVTRIEAGDAGLAASRWLEFWDVDLPIPANNGALPDLAVDDNGILDGQTGLPIECNSADSVFVCVSVAGAGAPITSGVHERLTSRGAFLEGFIAQPDPPGAMITSRDVAMSMRWEIPSIAPHGSFVVESVITPYATSLARDPLAAAQARSLVGTTLAVDRVWSR